MFKEINLMQFYQYERDLLLKKYFLILGKIYLLGGGNTKTYLTFNTREKILYHEKQGNEIKYFVNEKIIKENV